MLDKVQMLHVREVDDSTSVVKSQVPTIEPHAATSPGGVAWRRSLLVGRTVADLRAVDKLVVDAWCSINAKVRELAVGTCSDTPPEAFWLHRYDVALALLFAPRGVIGLQKQCSSSAVGRGLDVSPPDSKRHLASSPQQHLEMQRMSLVHDVDQVKMLAAGHQLEVANRMRPTEPVEYTVLGKPKAEIGSRLEWARGPSVGKSQRAAAAVSTDFVASAISPTVSSVSSAQHAPALPVVYQSYFMK